MASPSPSDFKLACARVVILCTPSIQVKNLIVVHAKNRNVFAKNIALKVTQVE